LAQLPEWFFQGNKADYFYGKTNSPLRSFSAPATHRTGETMKILRACPGKTPRERAVLFFRVCAACLLIPALCLLAPLAVSAAPSGAEAWDRHVHERLSNPGRQADVERMREADARGEEKGVAASPRTGARMPLAPNEEARSNETRPNPPAGKTRQGTAPAYFYTPPPPRSLPYLLTEQAASFLGIPAPMPLGMDEGLGYHQDGTVRKAGLDMYGPGPEPFPGSRTTVQTFDFSDFNPLRMVKDRALSWGVGALNTSAETLLSGLTDNGRARLNFTIDWDGHFRGEGDVLLPFHDSRYTTVFTQIGARSMIVSGGEADGKDRWIGNFGLGQRWFPNATEEDSGDWMIGYNAFLDIDFTRSHRRGGVGVEARYDWLHLASNYYFPLSGWKSSHDFDRRLIEERSAEGWDARVKAYLPSYRNVALTGAYTQWYGDRVGMFGHRNLEKNPKVWSYGVEYTPVPLISGFLTQRGTERGKTDTEFGLNITYRFGVPWKDQIKPARVAERRTVSGSRHEFVDRENRIVLEYRTKNAYRIEYLGQADKPTNLIHRFQVKNGFNEVVTGQTVYVTANGDYLADGGQEGAGVFSKSYVTNKRGEIQVELHGASLSPDGAVTVTARAGKSEQTFTLYATVTIGIEYLGPLDKDTKLLHEFQVTKNVGKVVAGQAVKVTANGDYLAEDGQEGKGVSSKEYVTDEEGKIVVELDPSSLPVGGVVSVTVRVGDNEQMFTLNGTAMPNGLFVEFTPPGQMDFTTAASGYQSTVGMTVKRRVGGVVQNLDSSETVAWAVTSNISLSADVWKRAANALNGLTWGTAADATSYSSSRYSWATNAVAGTAPSGTGSATHTASLTDVVGSRTITVTVTVGGETSSGDSFTFGRGPLSVFSKAGTSGIKWAEYGSDGSSGGFQDPNNSFPAAAFCGGRVSPYNQGVTTTGSSDSANFTSGPSGGWSNEYPSTSKSAWMSRYAQYSKLPKMEQLLAVAAYDSRYSAVPERKGAAWAAGWTLDRAWAGEVRFNGATFVAANVVFQNGYYKIWPDVNNDPSYGVAGVCLP
jgi:hypothetical protein